MSTTKSRTWPITAIRGTFSFPRYFRQSEKKKKKKKKKAVKEKQSMTLVVSTSSNVCRSGRKNQTEKNSHNHILQLSLAWLLRHELLQNLSSHVCHYREGREGEREREKEGKSSSNSKSFFSTHNLWEVDNWSRVLLQLRRRTTTTTIRKEAARSAWEKLNVNLPWEEKATKLHRQASNDAQNTTNKGFPRAQIFSISWPDRSRWIDCPISPEFSFHPSKSQSRCAYSSPAAQLGVSSRRLQLLFPRSNVLFRECPSIHPQSGKIVSWKWKCAQFRSYLLAADHWSRSELIQIDVNSRSKRRVVFLVQPARGWRRHFFSWGSIDSRNWPSVSQSVSRSVCPSIHPSVGRSVGRWTISIFSRSGPSLYRRLENGTC